MIVYSFGRFFNFFQRLLESQGKEVGFEEEFEGLCFDVELTGCYFDVGYSNVDDYMCIVLF